MTDQEFRLEHDSMGEVKVPQDALYGAQTQRAVENFTISTIPLPWSFLVAVLNIKSAAAATNRDLGYLPGELAGHIIRAVDQLLAEKPIAEFPVPVLQTGSGTSTNMNVNEVIVGVARRNGCELSANDQVNMGQSSNDVIPSALHISAAVTTWEKLLPALKNLAAEIRNFATANHDVIKTGRTHLMDALPIRLAAEFEAWAVQLDEAMERLQSGMKRLLLLPLGGTAVGSGVNCHPEFPVKAIERIRAQTGLPFIPSPSPYKGLSSLDTTVEFSGHLKACAIVLNKIANDLRWMNSGPLAGLAEISLPALQPGSSIMPAKVNPVIPEAVTMAVAQVLGNDTTISFAAAGGNFQLNTMLPVAASKIIESIELLSGSANALAQKAINGMRVNRDNCEQPLALNPILVTSLNPVIGYLKAAEIGKRAMREKRSVLDVALEQTDISREELVKLLDPANLADGGKI